MSRKFVASHIGPRQLEFPPNMPVFDTEFLSIDPHLEGMITVMKGQAA